MFVLPRLAFTVAAAVLVGLWAFRADLRRLPEQGRVLLAQARGARAR